MCKFPSVEGILVLDLCVNNIQSLGFIEVAKLISDSKHNRVFLRTKKIKPRL